MLGRPAAPEQGGDVAPHRRPRPVRAVLGGAQRASLRGALRSGVCPFTSHGITVFISIEPPLTSVLFYAHLSPHRLKTKHAHVQYLSRSSKQRLFKSSEYPLV